MTHFLALRVAPDALRATAEGVRTALVAADRDLAKCLIPSEKFHVTLGLLFLGKGDDGARQRAEAALVAAAAALPPTVTFPGLASFGERVLFANVADAAGDGRLEKVAAVAKRALEAHGFPNQPEFAPHVTLAKTSKWRGRVRRPKIAKEDWASLGDTPAAEWTFAAEQTLGTIELLARAGDNGAGGYPVVAAAALGGGTLKTVVPPYGVMALSSSSDSARTTATPTPAGSARVRPGDSRVRPPPLKIAASPAASAAGDTAELPPRRPGRRSRWKRNEKSRTVAADDSEKTAQRACSAACSAAVAEVARLRDAAKRDAAKMSGV